MAADIAAVDHDFSSRDSTSNKTANVILSIYIDG